MRIRESVLGSQAYNAMKPVIALLISVILLCVAFLTAVNDAQADTASQRSAVNLTSSFSLDSSSQTQDVKYLKRDSWSIDTHYNRDTKQYEPTLQAVGNPWYLPEYIKTGSTDDTSYSGTLQITNPTSSTIVLSNPTVRYAYDEFSDEGSEYLFKGSNSPVVILANQTVSIPVEFTLRNVMTNPVRAQSAEDFKNAFTEQFNNAWKDYRLTFKVQSDSNKYIDFPLSEQIPTINLTQTSDSSANRDIYYFRCITDDNGTNPNACNNFVPGYTTSQGARVYKNYTFAAGQNITWETVSALPNSKLEYKPFKVPEGATVEVYFNDPSIEGGIDYSTGSPVSVLTPTHKITVQSKKIEDIDRSYTWTLKADAAGNGSTYDYEVEAQSDQKNTSSTSYRLVTTFENTSDSVVTIDKFGENLSGTFTKYTNMPDGTSDEQKRVFYANVYYVDKSNNDAVVNLPFSVQPGTSLSIDYGLNGSPGEFYYAYTANGKQRDLGVNPQYSEEKNISYKNQTMYLHASGDGAPEKVENTSFSGAGSFTATFSRDFSQEENSLNRDYKALFYLTDSQSNTDSTGAPQVEVVLNIGQALSVANTFNTYLLTKNHDWSLEQKTVGPYEYEVTVTQVSTKYHGLISGRISLPEGTKLDRQKYASLRLYVNTGSSSNGTLCGTNDLTATNATNISYNCKITSNSVPSSVSVRVEILNSDAQQIYNATFTHTSPSVTDKEGNEAKLTSSFPTDGTNTWTVTWDDSDPTKKHVFTIKATDPQCQEQRNSVTLVYPAAVYDTAKEVRNKTIAATASSTAGADCVKQTDPTSEEPKPSDPTDSEDVVIDKASMEASYKADYSYSLSSVFATFLPIIILDSDTEDIDPDINLLISPVIKNINSVDIDITGNISLPDGMDKEKVSIAAKLVQVGTDFSQECTFADLAFTCQIDDMAKLKFDNVSTNAEAQQVINDFVDTLQVHVTVQNGSTTSTVTRDITKNNSSNTSSKDVEFSLEESVLSDGSLGTSRSSGNKKSVFTETYTTDQEHIVAPFTVSLAQGEMKKLVLKTSIKDADANGNTEESETQVILLRAGSSSSNTATTSTTAAASSTNKAEDPSNSAQPTSDANKTSDAGKTSDADKTSEPKSTVDDKPSNSSTTVTEPAESPITSPQVPGSSGSSEIPSFWRWILLIFSIIFVPVILGLSYMNYIDNDEPTSDIR